MEKIIKLALLDDHQLVLNGLTEILSKHKDFEISYTNTNPVLFHEEYTYYDIDLFLIDINMPSMSGLEVSKRILRKDDDAKVILLTMELKQAYIEQAIVKGISGYISKSAPVEELYSAIRSVYEGDQYFKIFHGFLSDN